MGDERGHGLESGSDGRQGNPDPVHAWRHPQGRTARRSRSAITPGIGKWAADAEAAAELSSHRRGSVRRLLHGPVRRTHTRHAGHVRQPALSERCRDRLPPPDPFAADALRRDRRRYLRQGSARDDDGAGRHADRCPAFWFPAARRCWRNKARMPDACSRWVPASRTTRSHWKMRRRISAAPAPAPAADVSFSALPPLRRWWARRWVCRLTHSALAPSGQPVWLDMARRSARAVLRLEASGITMGRVLTDASVRNAMVVHAAFGGSTNLILHIPAIAHAAGLRRPTVADWTRINREIPRIVDALPNGPRYFPTVQVFMAGGVPEVMLHLRRAGLLDLIGAHCFRRNAGHHARLVGAIRTPARRFASACRPTTASIRMT